MARKPMNIGARRDDLRSLYGVVQIRIGLQMVDQADIRIDGIADAPVAKILDLPNIPGCGRRRGGDESEKAGKTAKCNIRFIVTLQNICRMITKEIRAGKSAVRRPPPRLLVRCDFVQQRPQLLGALDAERRFEPHLRLAPGFERDSKARGAGVGQT